MKKIVLFVLCLVMLAICGCGKQADESKAGAASAVPVTTRVASLKGPTSMGLVQMMEDGAYSIYASADEIVALIAKDEVDIALIPANVAATLYQKTNHNLVAVEINAANVLYGISGQDNEFISFEELRGKTIYTTGKGTTPEWTLRYLLQENNMSDINLEFKSEASEVISALQANPDALAVLPQPFATSAVMQSDSLHIVFSVADEWKQSDEQFGPVTGVTIVRKAFLEEHPESVEAFLEKHADSVQYAQQNPKEAAALIEKYGIVKAPIAQKVLEEYNPLTATVGEDMKQWLSDYYSKLYAIAPEAVGGELPDDAFYYTK